MTVFVSSFFSPLSPRRPPNFVVLKYFLLGLLISNSIESILIIPKILDVLDQNKMQHKEIEEINLKREEVKELVEEAEKEVKEIDRERGRELRRLEQLQADLMSKGAETESNKKEREHLESKHGKHYGSGHQNKTRQHHVQVRKKPQKKDTGTNPVAVFMLFYGSTTLCLGIAAVFYEKVLLITILIGISCLGTITVLSANFSLLLILSVAKDILIAGLCFMFRQMIVQSEDPLAGQVPGMAAPGVVPQQQMDYSAQGMVGTDPSVMAVDPNMMVQGQQPGW